MEIKDLHPYFFICTEGHEIKHGTTMVKVEDCIASAIAYMFNLSRYPEQICKCIGFPGYFTIEKN